jgi:pilus assembly protein CpaF
MATTTDAIPIYVAVETGDGQVDRLRIDHQGQVLIGRDPSCHIVLPSSDVSRRHVTLEMASSGGLTLHDSSANGTLVGEPPERVWRTAMTIDPETPFRIGPYRLAVIGPQGSGLDALAPLLGRPGDPAVGAPERGAQWGAPASGDWEPPGPTMPGTAGAGATGPGAVPTASAPLDPWSQLASTGAAPPRSTTAAPPRSTTAAEPIPSSPTWSHQPAFPDQATDPGNVPSTRSPTDRMEPVAPTGPGGSSSAPKVDPTAFDAPALGAAPYGGAPESTVYGNSGTADVSVAARRRIHRLLLDHLDLANLDRTKMDQTVMRPRVREALTRICRQIRGELPPRTNLEELIEELTDEVLGLGPLEKLIADQDVTEIMVVDPQTIYIERAGRIERTDLRFTDDKSVRAVIERIVTPLGRRIDESTPLVDARLADGSRVNAVIPPLALRGPCITIRKFRKDPLKIHDLIRFGTLTEQMARFLVRTVITRKNVVISGGTGSGKTTLLNVLSAAIPELERIVTIEDAAELRLSQPHVVSLEARPPNMEGKGAITIRDLLRNALRMRPDRIIVGECRGGEALDMLQAMNTGHEGSMTTTHANSTREALARLETLGLMSGLDLPARAIREQIASSIHVVVQQSRFSDGSRRITNVSEVIGMDEDGAVELHDIFRFYRTGTGPRGEIEGEYRATGYLPSFLDEFITHGLVRGGEYL